MSRVSGHAVALIIFRREMLRFRRQPARIVAAVGTPLLIWLLMAGGMAESFRPEQWPGVAYGPFLLPGIMALVTLFASIFSSIAVIEDRQAGWLQSVMVSPAPRWAIAAGKIAAGGLLGWAQAAVLLAATPWMGSSPGAGAIAGAAAGLALTSIATAAMGLAFAWRSETSAGFHAVMNLVLLPMWMLSSAMFPLESAHPWLGALMRINPLSWCIESMRGPLLGRPATASMIGAAAFALVMCVIATVVVSRPRKQGA